MFDNRKKAYDNNAQTCHDLIELQDSDSSHKLDFKFTTQLINGFKIYLLLLTLFYEI